MAELLGGGADNLREAVGVARGLGRAVHSGEEVAGDLKVLGGREQRAGAEVQDAVVVLRIHVAVVVEGIVGDEGRTHNDGRIDSGEGTDGVGEGIILNLQRGHRTLADVDEVTAGELGTADSRDDVALELRRGHGTCHIHIEQTVLESRDLGIAQSERTHLHGGVGHLECVVHGRTAVKGDAVDAESGHALLEDESSDHAGPLGTDQVERVHQGDLAVGYVGVVGYRGQVIGSLLQGDGLLACGNGSEQVGYVLDGDVGGRGAAGHGVPARVADTGVHRHAVDEGEVVLLRVLERVGSQDGAASGEAFLLGDIGPEGVGRPFLAVLAVVVIVVAEVRGDATLAAEFRESVGVGRVGVDEDRVEDIALHLVAQQARTRGAADVEDTVVVLAGRVGGDLVESIVLDRRVVHLVGCISAHEGAAAVRKCVVAHDEIVVRARAEVDEVGARGAVLDDVALEDEVLDVGDGLA